MPHSKIEPPVAPHVPFEHVAHGDVRPDPYAWLRDPAYPIVSDQRILDHLKAENRYVEAVLPSGPGTLRSMLLDEMTARIVADDASVPYRHGAYLYWRRFLPGAQRVAYYRRRLDPHAEDEAILVPDRLAEGRRAYQVGGVAVSPDHRLLAFAEDIDGSERWTIRILDMSTGDLLDDRIENRAPSIAWATDNRTLFTIALDRHQRPTAVVRHRLGDAAGTTLFTETDPTLFVRLSKTASEKFVLISSFGKTQSEVRLLEADDPDGPIRIVTPRRPGHLYSVTHQADRLLIRTNDRHRNFRLVEAPLDRPGEGAWRECVPPSDAVYLNGLLAFRDWLALFERVDGLQRVRIMKAGDPKGHRIAFPDPAYHVEAIDNLDFDARTLRLRYQSLATPRTVFDYDADRRALKVRKVDPVPGGFDPAAYQTERLMATARDGTTIPVSIVHRRDFPRDRTGALYLLGYGAYGIGLDPTFSPARLSLLDRGIAYAIAHVRGGDELGYGWYEAGKLEHKMNSFTDFIDVSRFLIDRDYTAPGRIVWSGGSAGGLLVGAVMNMAPELSGAVVARVPFVDILTTMLDETLPLTTVEYAEWGDPRDPADYGRIKGYSPYDNVTAKDYPPILITAGLSDPRVTYWEPAKWAAKLRARTTGRAPVLLKTDMGGGHRGASGRYDALEDLALEYAFVLTVLG